MAIGAEMKGGSEMAKKTISAGEESWRA